MKRLYTACMWFLIAAFGSLAFLSGCAELERREEAELREMIAKHDAEERARVYGELEAKGKYMVAYDQIKGESK